MNITLKRVTAYGHTVLLRMVVPQPKESPVPLQQLVYQLLMDPSIHEVRMDDGEVLTPGAFCAQVVQAANELQHEGKLKEAKQLRKMVAKVETRPRTHICPVCLKVGGHKWSCSLGKLETALAKEVALAKKVAAKEEKQAKRYEARIARIDALVQGILSVTGGGRLVELEALA